MTSAVPLSPFAHAASHGTEVQPSNATQAHTLETLSCLLRYPLLRARDLSVLMGLSLSATAARLAYAQADGLARTLPASLLGAAWRILGAYPCGPGGSRQAVWPSYLVSGSAPSGGPRAAASDSRLPGLLITQSFTLALIAHAPEIASETPLQQITWSWTRTVRLRSLQTDGAPQSGYPSLRCDAAIRLTLRAAVHQSHGKPTELEAAEESDSWTIYRFVILWDSGLSRTYDVRRQLRLLLRIRDTYERQGRFAAFPALLVLAPDAHRATLWQAQALRLATEHWLTHPLLGGALALNETSEQLAVLGPMGTISPSIHTHRAGRGTSMAG